MTRNICNDNTIRFYGNRYRLILGIVTVIERVGNGPYLMTDLDNYSLFILIQIFSIASSFGILIATTKI
jgi:hypothetical protein